MSLLEIVLTVLVVVLVAVLIVAGLTWFIKRGNPELRAIRKERKENERSSDLAAMRASEQIAGASAMRREVRHTRRQFDAEESASRHERELDRLFRGEPSGTTTDIPGEPPPPPEH